MIHHLLLQANCRTFVISSFPIRSLPLQVLVAISLWPVSTFEFFHNSRLILDELNQIKFSKKLT